MKYIVKAFEWLIFIALIVILVATISPLLPTKDKLSTYSVASGSMEPTIPTGGLVATTGIDPKQIKVGDIITFTQPTNKDKVIVHRVVEINNTLSLSFKTKGDNNNATDTWTVSPSNILGKSLFSIPYLGFVVMWLKTPVGFAIGMGIPAIILVILQIKKIKQGIHEEVEKKTNEAFKKQYPHIFNLLFFALAVLVIPTKDVLAVFSSQATVNGINLSVLIPSVTPSVSPSLSPSPTPGGTTGGRNIIISGNGAGSTNTVTVNQSYNTSITQSNNTSVVNTISNSSSTGNNNITDTTNNQSSITTGNAESDSTSTTTTGVNTITTTTPSPTITPSITPMP